MKKKLFDDNLKAAIACLIVIAIIVALSASPIGWKIEKQAVSSVALKEIVVVRQEGEPEYGPGPGIPVYTITIINTFIPRQYQLPFATACLYNSELKATSYANVQWDVKEQPFEFGPSATSLEITQGTKTATLKVFSSVRYKSKEIREAQQIPEKPVPVAEAEVYDQLLLFLTEAGIRNYGYVDCYNLQADDFEAALKILITK